MRKKLKEFFGKAGREKVRQYWDGLMQSALVRMSRGANYIRTMMHFPHKDNWRQAHREKKK
jgi:hypothetical protein